MSDDDGINSANLEKLAYGGEVLQVNEPSSLAPAQCSAADDARVEIVAVIRLPLPMNGFIGLLQGIQKDFDEPLYIRNSPEGYEVFRKQQNDQAERPG